MRGSQGREGKVLFGPQTGAILGFARWWLWSARCVIPETFLRLGSSPIAATENGRLYNRRRPETIHVLLTYCGGETVTLLRFGPAKGR